MSDLEARARKFFELNFAQRVAWLPVGKLKALFEEIRDEATREERERCAAIAYGRGFDEFDKALADAINTPPSTPSKSEADNG